LEDLAEVGELGAIYLATTGWIRGCGGVFGLSRIADESKECIGNTEVVKERVRREQLMD
jgi:hypothetical protein